MMELQFSLLIGVIVLAAAVSLYLFYWRTFVIGNAILDVYTNSRIAAEWMVRDIRSAAQVVPSHDTYTTTDNSIVLQIPSIDSSGDVIGSHYDHIIYQLQDSDLYRIVKKDSSSARQEENRAIAHYCTSLNFSSGGVTLSEVPNLSAINEIGIYLPLNKTTLALGGGEGEVSITPTTVIRMRNK